MTLSGTTNILNKTKRITLLEEDCKTLAGWLEELQEYQNKELKVKNRYKKDGAVYSAGYNDAVDEILDLFGCEDEDLYATNTINQWLLDKERNNG